MNLLQSGVYFIVSFAASAAGAVCGIGGGVIIRPVLDLFGWDSVSAISFLSGCTVLAMSWYSVVKSLSAQDDEISLEEGTPLGAGAALGGIAGKQLFTLLQSLSGNPNAVGAVQSAALAAITLGTLLYTLNKSKIRTLHVTGTVPCLLIGGALGLCSSFLGIGGGPINLVVLGFFFGMETKKAAANSLYIILFSQLASLLFTLAARTVPVFSLSTLILMVIGGVLGGMAGRRISRGISAAALDRLFAALMTVIILLCVYNTCQYMQI